MKTINYQILQLDKGERVLDLGCGEGRHVSSIAFDYNIESIGIDLSPDDIKKAKTKAQELSQVSTKPLQLLFLAGDGTQLPFSDNSFDRIICSEVLEHIPDYQQVLVEIQRILKPKGLLAVSVPRYWPEKICWWLSKDYPAPSSPGGHIRIFKANHLKKDIEQHGFKQYAYHWAHALHAPFWWLKCLFWESKDRSLLVRWYHKILVWDLVKKPKLTQGLEKLLNPVMGKSIVMYFTKGEQNSA